MISVRPERPSSIPSSPPTRFTNLHGAAVDLTIVRPAAAAPPRRLEQVGPIAGRSADRRRWVGAPLAFSANARAHHLRPEPDSSKKEKWRRRQQPRASRARGIGAKEVNEGAPTAGGITEVQRVLTNAATRQAIQGLMQ